jgi:hypothetical protein
VLCSLALGVLATEASAATFVVNSTEATADAVLDGTCDADPTPDFDCTLQAAIQESNFSGSENDTINFSKTNSGLDADDDTFTASDSAADTFINGSPVDVIDRVTIDAGDCSGVVDAAPVPCANLNGKLTIDGASEVTIRGLAFLGAGGGIQASSIVPETNGIPDLQVYGNYFGVDTDGGTTLAAPTTSLKLEDVTGARIGSFLTDRNVFARHGVGIDIEGADGTEIFRNTFGLLPNGTIGRDDENFFNDDSIEVTGTASPDNPATGTLIGASSDDAAATPECDGGCNVIAFAGVADLGADSPTAAGIDLNGDGGNEVPASGAQILGNQIGAAGANSNGIVVGDADNVEIGGPAAGDADRNLFRRSPVTSGDGAGDLLIQNNLVTDTGTEEAPFELSGSGQVLDNVVPVVGSVGIRLTETTTPNFLVQGNILGEPEIANNSGGIVTSGIDLTATASGNTIGGTGAGEGNLIADPTFGAPTTPAVGITIAGDDNEVLGNTIGDARAPVNESALSAGVRLHTDADDNVIGGDDTASQNVISDGTPQSTNSGNAIEILDAASDGNVIARNVGADNQGLFIDLGGDGIGNAAEPVGPNGGIQAPDVAQALTTGLSGTAPAGSVVRIFTKATSDPGEIGAFFAQTTADGAGNWTAPATGFAAGDLIAATATGASGTSELSGVATVAAPEEPPITDTDPPETSITKKPKKKIKKKTATFAFAADEAGSTFTCQLDKKAARPCISPLKVKRLKKGKHVFTVFATDAAGNADPTPAQHEFKVKKKKKKR